MILLELLKYLELAGLGTIDEDLFFQLSSLERNNSMYIVSLGENIERGQRQSMRYEIYSIGNSINALKRLEKVRELLSRSYGAVNQLGEYKGVAIYPPSSVSNLGLDSKKRQVYSISGKVIYS